MGQKIFDNKTQYDRWKNEIIELITQRPHSLMELSSEVGTSVKCVRTIMQNLKASARFNIDTIPDKNNGTKCYLYHLTGVVGRVERKRDELFEVLPPRLSREELIDWAVHRAHEKISRMPVKSIIEFAIGCNKQIYRYKPDGSVYYYGQ